MKNKYWSLTTLIVTILIVILCYFAYQKLIYPIYLKNELQTTEIYVNKGKEVVLLKSKKQQNVYAIEIDFKGELSSNGTIILSDSIGIPNQIIRLKKGDIDYFYTGDLYSSSCKLTFKSENELKGNLKINYRFLALN